jgi:IS30 family transposase
MTLPYIHLSLADRREFARMYASKIPISVIADRLQRHHSTIYREIKWNWVHDEEPLYRGYSSVATDMQAGAWRQRATARLCVGREVPRELHSRWA